MTSLTVVLTLSHFTYNLLFVLMDSFNDSDSHHFRVLYFCLTICLGKLLLNNLSKVEWNRLNDSCAFPEIYRDSQSIYCLLRHISLHDYCVHFRNLKWVVNVDNRKVIWNIRVDYTLYGESLITCEFVNMLSTRVAECFFTRVALRWRHNGGDSVSNHQPNDCLLNRLFGRRSK